MWAEALESRLIMVATPINVASGMIIASGLPLPGLAVGSGFPASAQTLPSSAVTVAPVSVSTAVAAPFVESPTGPSTTLSPLMTDSETANAAASEVARPRPGQSDRVQSFIEVETVPVPELRVPNQSEVIPGPELLSPEAPAAPALQPAVPAANPTVPTVPALPVEAVPAPAPGLDAEVAEEAVPVHLWDASLQLLGMELDEDAPVSLSTRTEGVLAAGALLAAWGGWKYGPSAEGRSRRRSKVIAVVATAEGVAGPV